MNLITYKIVSDVDGRLKTAARTACNFWNRFVVPSSSIVIRLGTFTAFGSTIAQAYQPYTKAGVVYGVIEFNTNFLSEFSDSEVAGTIAHGSLSHWDEEKFGNELMTGFKSGVEHVLPVTIDVAALLGHKVNERLKKKTPLNTLLTEVAPILFTQKVQAKALDLDYFVKTPIWEETYDFGRRKKPIA
jgi:hypothetical protein